jgi:Ca2+:H+ antiporter
MIVNLLLLLVPLSVLLEYVLHAPPVWIFVASLVAIVPLAEWIRRATENLAVRAGSEIGGLVNVTFGNMAELIIALFILRGGAVDVVKAQITGSLIGNALLGLGLAIVVGGWKKQSQTFPPERAGLQASLLILSVIALLVPALFDFTERGLNQSAIERSRLDEELSLGVSVVLIIMYVANIAYTLFTHKSVFSREDDDASHTEGAWSLAKSIGVLLGATAFIALEAELVSGALEETSSTLGLSPFFLGVTVLAVVGNAAEYVSAVYFARRDKMGLVFTITVGATVQVALLTAPILVIASYFMGNPMNLVFRNPIELIAIAAVAFAVNAIAHDGETTWFEGLLLLAGYVILGMAFYLVR